MDIQYTVHVYVIYVHLIKSNVVLACIVDFRIGTLCTKSFTCIHRNIKKIVLENMPSYTFARNKKI